MTGAIRRHAFVMVVALVTASLTAGAPALAAKAVKLAKKAKFAKNAGKLDGLDSTAFARPGDITWSNLSGIPAGFADGIDAVGGTADDVACGSPCVSIGELDFDPATQSELDAHDHYGQLWSGAGGFGLQVHNADDALNAVALYGNASSDDGEVHGVLGQTHSNTAGASGVFGFVNTTNGTAVRAFNDAPSGPGDELALRAQSTNGDHFQAGSAGSAVFTIQNDGEVVCPGCIGTTDLAFDPATQAELDAHHDPLSADHDDRYFTEAELTASGAGGTVHWDNLTNVPAGLDDGDDDTTYTASQGIVLQGNDFQLGDCAANEIWKRNGTDTAWICAADDVGPSTFWNLAGNDGTNPATDFVGTTDNTPLEVRVNDDRVARFEPDATSPSVIFGFSGNDVSTSGATIGGGGQLGAPNEVLDDFGTVGGGAGNEAGHPVGNADFATVAGGEGNTASNLHSTVGGGDSNTASGQNGAIAGGVTNTASGGASHVGGGASNTASNGWSTVGGGSENSAIGVRATVGGGNTNVADGNSSTVGGGAFNNVAANYGTISGGAPSNFGDTANTRNDVTDEYGTVGGGGNNQAGDGAASTTNATFATVGGGGSNEATGGFSTVGGGFNSDASGSASTVGGGSANAASTLGATIGGGQNNTASGVGHATVGGGGSNTASGQHATVGGGGSNTASGATSTIAGGSFNTAGAVASIGGGNNNSATGTYAIIPGGVRASAPLHGQMAHASGEFAATGDAQTSQFVLRNSTPAATPTELFLDGLADRLTLDPGRRLAFEAYVVGGTAAGESGGYLVSGLIENIAGTTSIVGSTVTELGEDDAAWGVAVSADDGDDALVISVTGDSADATRWVAMLQTAEVVF